MSGCQTCGGFGNRHDPIAHDLGGDDITTPDPVVDVWELLWTAACDYRDANPHQRSEARLIDALMPIVREYGDLRAVEVLERRDKAALVFRNGVQR